MIPIDVLKFNPNHDDKGKFSSSPGGGKAADEGGIKVYRGIDSEEGHAATKRGEMGHGVFGTAIYTSESKESAARFGNASRDGKPPPNPHVMSGVLHPDAKMIDSEAIPNPLPDEYTGSIASGNRGGAGAWARDNGYDGITATNMDYNPETNSWKGGNWHMIVNPSAVAWNQIEPWHTDVAYTPAATGQYPDNPQTHATDYDSPFSSYPPQLSGGFPWLGDDHTAQLDWASSLSSDQIHAFNHYSMYGWHNVGRHLRGRDLVSEYKGGGNSKTPSPDEVQHTVDLMDAGFATTPPLQHSTILYRGVHRDFDVKEGEVLTDPSFPSTSTEAAIAIGKFATATKLRYGDPGYEPARNVTLFRINVPEGAHVINMTVGKKNKNGGWESLSQVGDDNEYGSEEEVLLPRNSRFKITDVDEPDGRTGPAVITMDLLPPGNGEERWMPPNTTQADVDNVAALFGGGEAAARRSGILPQGPIPRVTQSGSVSLAQLPNIPGWKKTRGKGMSVPQFCAKTQIDYNNLTTAQIDQIRDSLPKTPALVYKATINSTPFEVHFERGLDPTDNATTPDKVAHIMNKITELAKKEPIPDVAFNRRWNDSFVDPNSPFAIKPPTNNPHEMEARQQTVYITIGDDPNVPEGVYAYTVRGSGRINIMPVSMNAAEEKLTSSLGGLGRAWSPPGVVRKDPPVADFVLTHEWGHLVDNLEDGAARSILKDEDGFFDTAGAGISISGYAASDNTGREAIAEAFAEHVIAPETESPAVKRIVKLEGWN